ncbi:MAG: sulfatase-like hydrolase/transferase [Candidatus Marinimicrobia bacterium]|nr:sulfatase-like hydrolase/transferase [Candidatus Neomarinimicrobiota bacterium]MBT3823568.1 sulfatase-like hydrolase/transferase [Candidatus Neomarinimicrobiota bacterium]MBT4129573.1 sulfatase-like hydrolase/transferase [Candidatus Neomarinimicrobiota bacterium]MBT4295901.1 sulfatase-like hydrolase/transferase [Candidatus Neomarinimicrobiota bacterium]MBT4420097.1 sulfatase-like hydrolase/transferase [Candidatus Neomarinimicrobiota bacterium]
MQKMNQSRREFLKNVGIGLAAATLPIACYTKKTETVEKPNILFVMADDMGPEWVSCYGAEEIITPNIDKLATEGMRFTNAYSMPKCTPTRASLLTGQYPWRTGWINHWDVPRWGAGCHFDWKHYTSFGKVMQSTGYTTAVAGKWQVNDFRVQPDALTNHGFDDWCMWTGYETGNKPSAERYWDPYLFTRDGSKTYPGQFGPDVFTDFLINFMSENRDKPMMIYYPMVDPHGPLVNTPNSPEAESNKEKFKGMAQHVDHQLGRLVKSIDDLGLRKKTVIIFTTDNGTARNMKTTMNGRKVRGGKGELGENGMHVPFVASCPTRIPKGTVTDALTDFTDMLPTFAEFGGASLPEGETIDGHSIARLLTGKAEDSDREWIMAMGGGVAKLTDQGVIPQKDYADRVIRDKQYKMWVSEGSGVKLFDLTADPGETTNLIDSSLPAIIAARKKFETAIVGFPDKDARPKYEPTPAQTWDLQVGDKYK